MTSALNFDLRGDRRTGVTVAPTDAQVAPITDRLPASIECRESLDLHELLARLRFWGEAVEFRNRRYQLLPGAEGVGMVPGGVLHWEDTAREGIALVVRNRHGTPINLLHVGCGAELLTRAEFLVDEPIWGGRILFRGRGSRTSPTTFTVCWHEDL